MFVVILAIVAVIEVVSVIINIISSNNGTDNLSNSQNLEVLPKQQFLAPASLPKQQFLAPASEPSLVDSFNFPLRKVTVNEQVLVESKVTNTQNKTQSFVYIVQVKDSEDITISISWISSTLYPNDKTSASQSWTPEKPGRYDIGIFVWDSIEVTQILSPDRKVSVNVEE